MDTLQAIQERRTVRHYDAAHRMSEAEIQELLHLALLSPTAFNIQHWRFVVVRDPALRRQLRAASWDQAQVTEASLLVVLCADLKAWAKAPDRYWKDAPDAARAALVPAIEKYYSEHPQAQRDEAMRSGGIAAQTLMLAAKAKGYDSCPMDGFDFEAVARLIRLPADHVIVMMVTIGKARKGAGARPGQLPPEEVIVTDTF